MAVGAERGGFDALPRHTRGQQLLVVRLHQLSFASLLRLGTELSQAVKQGDILLYFTDPGDEALARRLGAAGGINATTSDYL